MTISVREADTSTTAIQPTFGPTSSLAYTLSAMRGRPVADASSIAHWNWTSGSDADARRSKVVDGFHRLSQHLFADAMNFIPVNASPGISPPGVMGATEEMREERFPMPSDMTLWAPVSADHSIFPQGIMEATGEVREEKFPVPSDMTSWSVHRQLYAVIFPLMTMIYPDLRDALRDLDEAKDEAREEGFPMPSDTALGNARRLLYAMYGLLPCRFEVYPTPDGEVAVHSSARSGRSILVLCDSDGGVLCLVNINGAHRRARYSDAGSLPDGFVREALAELQRRGEQVE